MRSGHVSGMAHMRKNKDSDSAMHVEWKRTATI